MSSKVCEDSERQNDSTNLDSTNEFVSPPIKALRLAPDKQVSSCEMSLDSASPQSAGESDREEKVPRKDAKVVLTDKSSVDKNAIGMWSCSKCTFLNHEVLPYCEMCDAKKPRQIPVTSKKNARSKPKESSKSKHKVCNTSKVSSHMEKNTSSSKNSPCSKSQKELHPMISAKYSRNHEISSSDSESEVLANSLAGDSREQTLKLESEDEESQAFEIKCRKKKRSTFSLASSHVPKTPTVSQDIDSESLYHPENVMQNERCPTETSENVIDDCCGSVSPASHDDSDVVIIDYSEEEEGNILQQSTPRGSGKNAVTKDTSPIHDNGIIAVEMLTPKHSGVVTALETSTPQRSDEAIVAEETAAALALFSPTHGKAESLTWICNNCDWENEPSSSLCEACLSDKPHSICKSSMSDIYMPWKCKTCEVENKSTDENCSSCGLPQPIFTSQVSQENSDGKSSYNYALGENYLLVVTSDGLFLVRLEKAT